MMNVFFKKPEGNMKLLSLGIIIIYMRRAHKYEMKKKGAEADAADDQANAAAEKARKAEEKAKRAEEELNNIHN